MNNLQKKRAILLTKAFPFDGNYHNSNVKDFFLKYQLEQLGFTVANFAPFVIQPIINNLNNTIKDCWLFTSPNAVKIATYQNFNFLGKYYAAIGIATQKRLQQNKVRHDVILTGGPPYTSEAFVNLLYKNQIFLNKKNWGIVTGLNGRPFLKMALEKIGIQAEIFAVYEREESSLNLENLHHFISMHKPYYVVTSQEAFFIFIKNYRKFFNENQNDFVYSIRQISFLASSSRIANVLNSFDITPIAIIGSAVDLDIINYFKQNF